MMLRQLLPGYYPIQYATYVQSLHSKDLEKLSPSQLLWGGCQKTSGSCNTIGVMVHKMWCWKASLKEVSVRVLVPMIFLSINRKTSVGWCSSLKFENCQCVCHIFNTNFGSQKHDSPDSGYWIKQSEHAGSYVLLKIWNTFWRLVK